MHEPISPTGVEMSWRALVPAPHPIRRLLLLLPNVDLNEAMLARALWTLAGEHGSAVHVVALIDDWADEGQVRMRVALLMALSRGSGVELVEHYERDTTDWLDIVRRLYRPGDVIVCHAEQTLPAGKGHFSAHLSPLSTHLAMLHMPVCELRGAIKETPAMTLRHALKVWGLPLLILVVSVAFEILFMRWARGWAEWSRQAALATYTALEIVSVVWLTRD
jgi:hypothetical protein